MQTQTVFCLASAVSALLVADLVHLCDFCPDEAGSVYSHASRHMCVPIVDGHTHAASRLYDTGIVWVIDDDVERRRSLSWCRTGRYAPTRVVL